MVNGAGGTQGGIGQFLIGFIMMCVGIYLLLSNIMVSTPFSMGMHLYSMRGMGMNMGITSGMIMFPFMFGVGIIFYNVKNYLGWLLAIGSIAALIFGVIASIQFHFRDTNAFNLIMILVLAVGGLGIFLRSFKSQ